MENLQSCIIANPSLAKKLKELDVTKDEMIIYEMISEKMGCEKLEEIIDVNLKISEMYNKIEDALVDYEILMAKMIPLLEEMSEKYEKVSEKLRKLPSK